MALEYHTYLLLSNNSFSVIWFVRMEGKKQFLSWKPQENVFPRNFILKEHADSSKSGEAVKTIFFFFLPCYDYPLLYFASSLKCEMTVCMQWSVYDACTKVGRRQNTSSPELLKHLLKRELLNCAGISCGETEYLLSTTEREDLWQSLA